MLLFFYSIDKVPKVTSPVLVIHGTEDEVINFSHGLAIYERCPRAVEPLWVEVSKIDQKLSNKFFLNVAFYFGYRILYLYMHHMSLNIS